MPEDTAAAVAAARRAGDDRGVADALAAHAQRLITEGRLADAVAALDEAAALLGDDDLSTSCLHWAATLSRGVGDLDGAEERARLARRRAAPGSATRLAATAELAEIDAARGHPAQAAGWLSSALDEAERLEPGDRAALLRKRAGHRAATGRFGDAADDAAAAAELLADGATVDWLAAVSEEVTARWQAGQRAEARERLADLVAAAEAAGDAEALANAAVTEAAMALDEGDPDRALDAARRAKDLALEAVAPLVYLSAAVTICELEDRRGDRLAAYTALATAWATLGDLLGREVAEQAVTPRLAELRARWGPEDFAAVKATHDEHRRRRLEG